GRVVLLPIWQLNKKEREVTLSPSLAPIADQSRKQSPILGGSVVKNRISVRRAPPGECSSESRIRFALVPDNTGDRVWDKRGDHGVVQPCGPPCISPRITWQLGTRGIILTDGSATVLRWWYQRAFQLS